MDAPARFWDRFEKMPNGCWLWGRAKGSDGYGGLQYQNKPWKSHRMAYTVTHGLIPDGLFVCHSCDIQYPAGDITYRLCGNPQHLFLGTQLDNVRDMWAKHRQRVLRGEEHPSATITAAQAAAIKEMAESGRIAMHGIAATLGINISTVSSILYNQGWHDTIGAIDRSKLKGHKLSPSDVRTIAEQFVGGTSARQLAAQFDLTLGMVYHIMRGRSWKDVVRPRVARRQPHASCG